MTLDSWAKNARKTSNMNLTLMKLYAKVQNQKFMPDSYCAKRKFKKIFKASKVILVREFILSCLLIASKSSHASKDLSIYKMRQWRIKRISPDQYVRGCLLINTNNQMIACMCEFLCANLRSNNVKDSFNKFKHQQGKEQIGCK